MADSANGRLRVSNTKTRVTDLVSLINDALDEGLLGFRNSQLLKGKLSFAQAQIFGLSSKYVLQLLSEHSYAKPFKPAMGQNLEFALNHFST